MFTSDHVYSVIWNQYPVTDFDTVIIVCPLFHSWGMGLLWPIDTIHEEIDSVRGVNYKFCGVRRG